MNRRCGAFEVVETLAGGRLGVVFPVSPRELTLLEVGSAARTVAVVSTSRRVGMVRLLRKSAGVMATQRVTQIQKGPIADNVDLFALGPLAMGLWGLSDDSCLRTTSCSRKCSQVVAHYSPRGSRCQAFDIPLRRPERRSGSWIGIPIFDLGRKRRRIGSPLSRGRRPSCRGGRGGTRAFRRATAASRTDASAKVPLPRCGSLAAMGTQSSSCRPGRA
jgi:hypothetical protein